MGDCMGTRALIQWRWTIRAALTTALLMVIPVACAQPRQDAHAQSETGAKWDAYVEQFLNSYFVAQPDFAAWQGRHEFDGLLPDWSAAGLKRESERLKSQRAGALAFSEGQLDERRQFERNYLLAQLDK